MYQGLENFGAARTGSTTSFMAVQTHTGLTASAAKTALKDTLFQSCLVAVFFVKWAFLPSTFSLTALCVVTAASESDHSLYPPISRRLGSMTSRFFCRRHWKEDGGHLRALSPQANSPDNGFLESTRLTYDIRDPIGEVHAASYVGADEDVTVADSVGPLEVQTASRAAKLEIVETVSWPEVRGARVCRCKAVCWGCMRWRRKFRC